MHGSSLLMDQVALCLAKDEPEYRKKFAVLHENLLRMADPVDSGLFAAAESDFCMLDVAYAPLFMRLSFLGGLREELLVLYPESVAVWAKRLLDRPSVAGSVVQDFRSRYIDFLLKKGSWLLQQVN